MTEIFAHHAHVFPQSLYPEGTIDVLLRLMDSCAIQRCVAFPPFFEQIADRNDCPNRWLEKCIANCTRLVGFGVVNLMRSDVEDQVRAIAEAGFYGIKLHPSVQRFAIVGENAMRLYAEAEKRGLFLTFHTGIHGAPMKLDMMYMYDEIAHQFPSLRFSLEHLGGYSMFDMGLAVLVNNLRNRADPQIYAGLTSVGEHQHYPALYLSDQRMRELFHQAGHRVCLFGLDFPYNDEAAVKRSIERLSELGLAGESLSEVLGGNLRRALRMN